jgi:hypothetical protein
MTALDKYVRLEAIGRWREGPAAAPREVVVSFGDATLVLTDLADRPLGHWALAGVQAIGRDGAATVYAMSPEGGETLTIADSDMVEAIAAVTRAHRLAPPPAAEPRSRAWIVALAAAVLAAAAIAWTPTLLREQAARMLPPEAAEVFGDQMLLQIMAATGPACADPAGRQALAALAAKVAGGTAFRLRAVDLGPAPVALLPGPTVAVGRAAIEQAEDPAEIAGWIAVALARETARPGPERLMTAVGPLANLRYIFTGALSDAALARATRAVFDPPTPEEIAAAYDRLAAAGIAAGPFADGLRRAGIEPPPAAAEGAPALPAREWAALQGLCARE